MFPKIQKCSPKIIVVLVRILKSATSLHTFLPSPGSPEIGGLTTIQALEIVRGCRGLNLVGFDVVEVSHRRSDIRVRVKIES